LASQNQLSNFVGRMDYQDFPGQTPPAQCAQFETGRICEDEYPEPPQGAPIGLIVGAIGGVGALVSVAIMLHRKHRQEATKPSTQGQAPVGRAPIPQQQHVVPMQIMQPMQPMQAVQAVPMQQPATTNVMVTCPPGLKPGHPMQVSGPGGQTMQVYVPEGTVPSGQFMVQFPAAPAVVQSAPVVQSGFFLG
jgi:hypothetical protein